MENSKIKVFTNFSDKKITENFGYVLNDYRKSSKFCDFILKTKDNCSYPVHKNIIQMNSEYFKKILFKNSESNELYFPDVKSSILNKIIRFMYTGEIDLSHDTVDEISNLANTFNLDSLELQCIKFKEYCKNLEKFHNKKESSSIETRKRKHSPLENKLEDQSEESTSTRQNLQVIRSQSPQQQPPPRKKIIEIQSGYRNLYAIFGNRLFSYDWQKTSFNQCITKYEEYRTHFAYSLFKGNSLFICGGNISGDDIINNGKKCLYYNFQINRWIKNIPELTYSRRQHRATTLHGKIYICGGENEKHTEIIDINGNFIKTFGPSLDVDMMNFGFCTLNTSIYALYGDKFRQYDPRELNWLRLIGPNGNCCNHFHESCSIIGYRDYIYKFDCKGISKFDIRASNWEIDKIYYRQEYKQSPFVCRLDEKIYLLEQCNSENTYTLQSYKISDLIGLPLNDVIVAYDRPAWAFFSTYTS